MEQHDESTCPDNNKIPQILREADPIKIPKVEVTYQVFMNSSQNCHIVHEIRKSDFVEDKSHLVDKSELENLKLDDEDDMAYTPDVSNYRSKYIKDDISTIQVFLLIF